ncbi:CLUMA_CG015538, isoform A [Clunio marinus]|uniref:CLUMA_CG015538, isoform A n=1 Tax=Clunio marinus TaxID=568069 RepID=A0A1J1IPJ3_9DIPT|nr:CLUMA_CG015538, isoform A [Clunio marinus]
MKAASKSFSFRRDNTRPPQHIISNFILIAMLSHLFTSEDSLFIMKVLEEPSTPNIDTNLTSHLRNKLSQYTK